MVYRTGRMGLEADQFRLIYGVLVDRVLRGLLNPTTETERRSSAASFFSLNNLS